jgi:alpha-tubulin suppressor-like RCC1 family protein
MTGGGATYGSETTWNNGTLASGGAILDQPGNLDPYQYGVFYDGIPRFQKGIDMSANHGSTMWRNIPDVSAEANNLAFVVDRQLFGGFNGTSAAAPIWAGFVALANQQAAMSGIQPVGFADPVMYAMAKTAGTANDIYAITFNDIKDNSNTNLPGHVGFPATPGYDLATGLGSPKCGLIAQLASATPLQMGPTPAVAVAPGLDHTCAVLGNGTVYCWGSNKFGQLGTNGVPADKSVTPLLVPGLTGVQTLDAGGNNTCVLLSDETLSCWGAGGSQQIGNSAAECFSLTSACIRSTPLQVSLPLATGATASAVSISVSGGPPFGYADQPGGWGHSCTLQATGEMDCWGLGINGDLGDNKFRDMILSFPVATARRDALQISAGGNHSCAVMSDSTVLCWGLGELGALGLGASVATLGAPGGPVLRSDGTVLTGVLSVATGGDHTCALMASGDVLCWGLNDNGQIGTTTGNTPCTNNGVATQCIRAPTVAALAGATAIAASGNETCAIVAGGSVKCWGANDRGQLGDGTQNASTTPVDVLGMGQIVSIGVGEKHSCAVDSNGAAACWGDNTSGELGNSGCVPPACAFSAVPLPVLLRRTF